MLPAQTMLDDYGMSKFCFLFTAIHLTYFRPGELDPDPESKPARPDTIDLDEDEKEMLSEARARLANTQGKKAKRKARERQLEESRRLAVLQKRRELKNAGINIKVTTTKQGQMDYNADIPFEKAPAPGFYDTIEEQSRNERQRETFDPRKQQLANKRKGDQDEDTERKKQKGDKNQSTSAAAAKAGRMQKIREAEQLSKRRALNLPAPQVGENELDDIIKMGLAGDKATKIAGEEEGGSRGLLGSYTAMVGGTPIRTPRAPPQEDHIANEIRNIRALTETQSSLLGGDNTPLHEGGSSTGFDGIAPRRQEIVTPNPMATPFRQGADGVGATPMRGGIGPGATPLRTPRDHFSLNNELEGGQIVGSTPREVKMRENFVRQQLRGKLASLPRPKETEWELEELPSESQEPTISGDGFHEDAEERDRREELIRKKEAEAEFKRQTQVYQRSLPRPSILDIGSLLERASRVSDPVESLIAKEAAILIANDARKHPLANGKIEGKAPKFEKIDDKWIQSARAAVLGEVSAEELKSQWQADFDASWTSAHEGSLPGLSIYDDEENDVFQQEQSMISAFDNVQNSLMATAEQGNKLEKKLALHYGGYQARAKTLRGKIVEAASALEKVTFDVDTFRTLQIGEEAALRDRLEQLRDEVTLVTRREREAQDLYKARKEELDELVGGAVNGWH
jgi:pre-mRNA-splicing factor CDC5/CEF1